MEHGAGGDASAVVVRPLAEDDVDAAVEMFAAVVAEGRWMGTEPGFEEDERRAAWWRGLADPHQRSFVAVATDGTIVGSASFHLAGYGVADLGMAVAAEWRGRGVGAQLLDALIAAASDVGAHKLSLQVWPHNARAVALYERRGFVREGLLRRHYRRASGELWDAVVMGLVLDETSPDSPFGGH
jgi:RimJ/RimL family protein N-acetyltransferase